MIDKQVIDEVFAVSQIDEVINEFIDLRKSGANFKALSPFTSEKTPSFFVSPQKQIWKDFSSGKGGNVVTFLMEHEHFTYPEAIRFLAKKYGIEIKETHDNPNHKKDALISESIFIILEYAKTYFGDKLWNSQEGKNIALTYFKERGFNENTIKEFNLGYSLDIWDAFTKSALEKNYTLEYLIKSGLTIQKEDNDNAYDRFRGRVIFPISSMGGRTLGFGARILTSDKKQPKYINSPESEVYKKSHILYGIFQAKKSISQLDNCYLVEGYTDVIQFHQSGIKNVVASGGTSLTSEQIRLIGRLTQNITLIFDNDHAGIDATYRGIDLILEQGLNVFICPLPDHNDPDSFAKNNPSDEVMTYLKNNAIDFITYKTQNLIEQKNLDSTQKADLINGIINSISKIENGVKRELYIQECSKTIQLSEDVLFNGVEQILAKKKRQQNRRLEASSRTPFTLTKSNKDINNQEINFQDTLERKIIQIILLYGNHTVIIDDFQYQANEDNKLELTPIKLEKKVFEKIYADLQVDEIEFANTIFKELYSIIVSFYGEKGYVNSKELMSEVTPEMAEEISDILMEEEKYNLDHWEHKHVFVKDKTESIGQLTMDTILDFRHLMIGKIIDNYQKEILKEDKNTKEILGEINDYLKLDNLFSRKFDRRIFRVLK